MLNLVLDYGLKAFKISVKVMYFLFEKVHVEVKLKDTEVAVSVESEALKRFEMSFEVLELKAKSN